MSRTRSERYDDIQAGILAKAARLFATRGYERTSIADLVEACQVSRGALYHYFDSKEAILYGMLDALVRGLLERLQNAVAESGTPRAVLERVIVAFVEYNARSPDEQIILLNDLGALSEPEQEQIKHVEREIVDLVGRVLAAVDDFGRMAKGDAKVYTMMLISIVNYTYAWYDADGAVTPAQYAAMTCDLFLNGFLAAPACGLIDKTKGRKRS
jgi:AcrR family transcriptional regulator